MSQTNVDYGIKKSEIIYLSLAVLFSVNLIVTNLTSVKLFQLPYFDIALPVGDITYPITFLVTDIVSEIWGKKRAGLIVLIGFVMNIFMFLIVYVMIKLPPHEEWAIPGESFGFGSAQLYQNAYESIFGVSSFLVFASMTTYLISQLIDVQIFHSCKEFTKGRKLWLRNNVSTMTSQLVDTVVFNAIFLYWGLGLDLNTCVGITFASYIGRFFLALFDTPFCYWSVFWIRNILKDEKREMKKCCQFTCPQ